MTDPVASDNVSEIGSAAYWLSAIKRAQTTDGMTRWADRCDVIRKRYKYEGSTGARVRRYQMLWSNMQTMKPAVYTKPPQAAVMRRYRDKDPTARVAADMIERAINFTIDANDFDSRFKQVRDDFLLYARGQARLLYEPEWEVDPAFTGTDNLDTDAVQGDAKAAEVIDARPGERLGFEHVKIIYLQRDDFVHAPARCWEEVPWVAFRSFLRRDELVARFGDDIGNAIPLDASPERKDGEARMPGDAGDDKATIWEVWDRADNSVLWVAKGYADILEKGEPYLKLEGFYPCPRPAYGTLTNDSLEPVPDYTFYQDQCEEIDLLTARIGALTESLKVVGLYPAGETDTTVAIEKMAKSGTENVMIPIPNWAQFKEGGGTGGAIEWWPVDLVGKVMEGCVKMRQQLITDVYQIYGLSDIMRGDGEASETATAQNIKAQFGSVRIRDRQQELARFCRDISRMIGEIVCEHFSAGTLMAMSNMPLPSEAALAQERLQQQTAALIAQARAQAPPLAPVIPPAGSPGLPQPMPTVA